MFSHVEVLAHGPEPIALKRDPKSHSAVPGRSNFPKTEMTIFQNVHRHAICASDKFQPEIIPKSSQNHPKIMPKSSQEIARHPKAPPVHPCATPMQPKAPPRRPKAFPRRPKRPWVSPRGLLGGAASGRTNTASRVRRVPRRRKHHLQACRGPSCPPKRPKCVQKQLKVVLSSQRRAYFHVSVLLSSPTPQCAK